MKNKIFISVNLDEISNQLDDAINFVIKNKIRFVEVRTIDDKNIINYDIKQIQKIADKLEKAKIKVSAIASPLFKWYLRPGKTKGDFDNYGFNPYLNENQKKEYIKKIIVIARIFKTKNVRVFSNLKQKNVKLADFDNDSLFDYMLSMFFEAGIIPLLENEPACLISKTEDYLKVLKKYCKNGLRAWWDIANTYDMENYVCFNTISQIAPYVGYLHIKDKALNSDKNYVPVGSGFINYKRIFSDLFPLINTKTFMSVETHVKTNKKEATQVSFDYLRKIYRSNRIAYAIVGAGRISSNHSKAIKINTNSEIRGVFDIDKNKADIFAKQNDVESYVSLNSMLSDPKIKVINICTPHNTHVAIAKAAILKNKIVLSEKPFAISSKTLLSYLKNVSADKNTYVIFQNLFNPPVRELLEAIDKNKLGRLRYFSINIRWSRDKNYFSDWHGKKLSSGGSLYNQAIHSIQLVDLIFHDQIKKISYLNKRHTKNSEVEDLGLITFKSKNGILGNIEMCLVNQGSDLECSLYLTGDRGSVKIGGNSFNKLIYRYYSKETMSPIVNSESDNETYGNGHVQLIKTLSDKLLKQKNPGKKYLMTANKTLPVIKLIENIYTNGRK